jgi:RNA polymerase sigma-70 factor (ECF subfamily)
MRAAPRVVARPPDPAAAALVRRVAAGAHAAMAELYDQSSAAVYGLALRVAGDPALAEEVVLEVYTQVWQRAAEYERVSASVHLRGVSTGSASDPLPGAYP